MANFVHFDSTNRRGKKFDDEVNNIKLKIDVKFEEIPNI